MPPLRLSARSIVLLLVGLQAAALLLVALGSLPGVYQWHALDMQIYYFDATYVLRGLAPYREFNLEYPPLALAAFLGPFVATLGRPLGFPAYAWLFLAQNILFSTLIALALARAAALWQPRRGMAMPLAVYALLVAIVAPLLPWRYDLFPALLTALGLVAVLAGRPAQAGVWLGLGVAAKLYPVVLLPIMGAYYLAGANWRALARLALGWLAALVVAMLPFLITSSGAILEFVRYHQQRGLQLESLPAGLILLAHMIGGARVGLGFNYGALHLVSPLADAALRWLPSLFVAVFGAVLLCALARFRQEYAARGAVAPASLVAYMVAALLAFIATNKVFSPQYIIWLLPFVPLLRPRQAGLLLAVFLITIALFPFGYADLLALRDHAVLLLNLRNLLVAGVLVGLVAQRRPSFAALALWRQA